MLTYEKILEVFGGYLTEDDSCEVLSSSRGYLVVDWNSAADRWITTRLCQSPEQLRDALRSHYEEYLGYQRTGEYKRELLPSEDADIRRMGESMAERCDEN